MSVNFHKILTDWHPQSATQGLPCRNSGIREGRRWARAVKRVDKPQGILYA